MDFKQLAENLELDEAEFTELLELFSNTGGKDIARLEKAIETGNKKEAERAAHSLKGSSATLGLMAIAEKAGLLEENLREDCHEDSFRLLEGIKENMNIIKKLIGFEQN